MSEFIGWNDGLAAHFFKQENAGRTVWLYLNEEIISEVGSQLGLGSMDDFVNATKAGPSWVQSGGLCQRALRTCDGWHERGLAYPPYIAFLSLFVLAAGLEGTFAAHSYYPRLRTLIGEPPVTGALPSFERMYELWDDLERWAVQEKDGGYGLFEARIAGGNFHIGLPLAQSILTDAERRTLTAIFAEAGFDPTAPPPDDEILRALRSYGNDRLRPRTQRLLSGTGDNESLSVLVDLVAEELVAWDGEILEPVSTGAGVQSRVHASLRLCLRLDPVAARATAFIRCSLNRREFPESGLLLSLPGVTEKATCDEDQPGWSTPLTGESTGKQLNASEHPWTTGLSATDARLGWRLTLPAGGVRLLVNGESLGLAGLVETHQLSRDLPFYLLFRDEATDQIQGWARESCHGFENVPLHEGLPSGWNLAYVARVLADDPQLRRLYPVLALPTRTTLRFVGGIRSASGNNFFAFAPPRLQVDGESGEEEVRCDGEVLRLAVGQGTHQLPKNLATEKRILIEVSRGGSVLRRQSLYLTGAFGWTGRRPEAAFDQWGELIDPYPESSDVALAGTALTGSSPDTSSFRRSILMTPGAFDSGNRRVFLIGRKPGQISTWPSEGLPADWDVVWAIPMERRGTAIYCGGDLNESAPRQDVANSEQNLELWKEILWHRRKKIAPPQQPNLRALWNQYIEVAGDV